jgi:hypothetical protein
VLQLRMVVGRSSTDAAPPTVRGGMSLVKALAGDPVRSSGALRYAKNAGRALGLAASQGPAARSDEGRQPEASPLLPFNACRPRRQAGHSARTIQDAQCVEVTNVGSRSSGLQESGSRNYASIRLLRRAAQGVTARRACLPATGRHATPWRPGGPVWRSPRPGRPALCW